MTWGGVCHEGVTRESPVRGVDEGFPPSYVEKESRHGNRPDGLVVEGPREESGTSRVLKK